MSKDRLYKVLLAPRVTVSDLNGRALVMHTGPDRYDGEEMGGRGGRGGRGGGGGPTKSSQKLVIHEGPAGSTSLSVPASAPVCER